MTLGLPANSSFCAFKLTASIQVDLHKPTALPAKALHVHHQQSEKVADTMHRPYCAWSGLAFDQHDCIRAAGWIMSCAAAVVLQLFKNRVLRSSAPAPAPAPKQELLIEYSDTWCLLLTQVVNGFWATAAAAMASDLLGSQLPVTRSAQFSHYYCGNFGIMMADACNQSIDTTKVRPSQVLIWNV